MEAKKKTYNTRDSLVVTDPTTDLALTGLSMRERTGSRVSQWVWSYVVEGGRFFGYTPGFCVPGRFGFMIFTYQVWMSNGPITFAKVRCGMQGLKASK